MYYESRAYTTVYKKCVVVAHCLRRRRNDVNEAWDEPLEGG